VVSRSFRFGLAGFWLLAGGFVSATYGQDATLTNPRPPRADTSGSANPPAEPEVTSVIELDDEGMVVDEEWGEIEDIENPDITDVVSKPEDDLSVEWDDDEASDAKPIEDSKPEGPFSLTGVVGVEFRTFPFNPGFANQKKSTFSPALIIEPELIYNWSGGKDRFTFKPYLILDKDDNNRSYFDIRELSFLHQGDGWDVLVGISKVFWGVTESRKLVDIVNQSDSVLDGDNEDKLGQPMVNFNVDSKWGALSLFVLPGFRERTFPGDDNRFRGPLPIADGDVSFESGAGKSRMDFAARWTQTFGAWDVGVSHFYGTSREPRLLLGAGTGGQPVLIPRYDIINQSGLDVQYTKDAWLWKFEAISRQGHGKRFFAAVGGFEYTEYQIFESQADLGLLLEFQYDGRDSSDAPGTFGDNDVFAGARLALNDEQDTTSLAGMIVDVETGASFLSVEAERRIGDNWKIELEARFSLFIPDNDVAAGFRKDDLITLRLNRYF